MSDVKTLDDALILAHEQHLCAVRGYAAAIRIAGRNEGRFSEEVAAAGLVLRLAEGRLEDAVDALIEHAGEA